MRRLVFVAACMLPLAGASFARSSVTQQAGPDPSKLKIDYEVVVDGLKDPVYVTNAGDGSGRLFILEKAGKARIFKQGSLVATPFLDVSAKIVRLNASYDERGLLGLAFHPHFATNGRVFAYYSAPLRAGGPARWNHTSRLVEFQVQDGDPDRVDPSSERLILEVDEPQSNHNGGQLTFGPDGYLYVGLGDGGGSNDEDDGHNDRTGNGQDRTTLLGKILRLDVDGQQPYTFPPTNPFYALSSARNEIWAFGLRNPWRFDFDRQTGELYIADVGQNEWEEVNVQPATSKGGENYGWRLLEGTHCFNPPSGCNRNAMTMPVVEYAHGADCSITGGYVYRGTRYADLVGAYFYGDYCSGNVWGMSRDAAGKWRSAKLTNSGVSLQSFGEGEDGEIYLTGSNGQILHLVSKTGGAVPTTPAPEPTATTAVPTAPVPTVIPTTPAPTQAASPTSTIEPTQPPPVQTPTLAATATALPSASPRPTDSTQGAVYLPRLYNR